MFAAVDYLRTLPFADTKRIGIMGYSLGGIVTMFAIRRSTTFAVAINQAGAAGALEHQCRVAQRAHRRSRKSNDAGALARGRE